MNKVKKENGITMLALVIIVVVLMILASFMINLGGINVDGSVDAKLDEELKMVQYAVMQQYMKYNTTNDPANVVYTRDYNNNILDFVNENYKGIILLHTPSESDEVYKKYYLINSADLKKLGIQESNYSYIVNYYTGEVFNANTFKTSKNKKLYIKGNVSNKENF